MVLSNRSSICKNLATDAGSIEIHSTCTKYNNPFFAFRLNLVMPTSTPSFIRSFLLSVSTTVVAALVGLRSVSSSSAGADELGVIPEAASCSSVQPLSCNKLLRIITNPLRPISFKCCSSLYVFVLFTVLVNPSTILLNTSVESKSQS